MTPGHRLQISTDGPDIADRLADAYSGIVGETSDELAVNDLMCVLSSRHYLAESLAADREQGHVPTINCHSRTLMSTCGEH